MKEKTALWIKLGMGILLSLLVVATGALLIQGCLAIYFSGVAEDNPDPFSRELVTEALGRIAPLAIVTAVAVIVSGVLHRTLLRGQEARQKPLISQSDRLKKVSARLSPSSPVQALLKKHRIERAVTIIVASVLSLGATIPFWVHLSQAEHFTMDFNASVVGLWLSAVPFLLVSGGLFVAVSFLADASRSVDVLAVKEALQTEAAVEKPALQNQARRSPWLYVKLGIAALAIALIAVGIADGGAVDVFQKAVRICTECIGLG